MYSLCNPLYIQVHEVQVVTTFFKGRNFGVNVQKFGYLASIQSQIKPLAGSIYLPLQKKGRDERSIQVGLSFFPFPFEDGKSFAHRNY